MEIWKDIQGYEGLYQVSDSGNVKSLNYNRKGIEKLMKPKLDYNGYMSVVLYKKGKCKRIKIHRLVMESFVTNTENKPCIDHINSIKTDNRVGNLRWCTHLENMQNTKTLSKVRAGCFNRNKGEDNPKCRKVKCLNTGEVFNYIGLAAKTYNIKSKCDISYCCKGKIKSAGKHPITGEKLIWVYENN